MAGVAGRGTLAFEHVLDEDTALSNFLVDDELLIIGGDEKDHCCSWWLAREKGMEEKKKRGRRRGAMSRNSVFKGVVRYVSILPFRTLHQKIKKMTWFGLLRPLQSATTSSPFSFTGELTGSRFCSGDSPPST